ncbi:transglycosylase SLT domain-containing protein [Acinetobacter johnsonii]|uniref:Transglycosylase SLT domain protein n=1 Tax=Acinetobacter johnsonii SH046 TaxID=575586 RepID=D0S8P3_ACIJO|nr:transglycosylase SLT domain-containing protein [Acinetobacter johnsonii]EEY97765.1 transglycosylase SLT domain protein [Acinetobacter johnsonii SH046]
MAAASLGRLTLDLAVKLSSYEQGMTQAERKTKDTTEKMGKAFGGFKSQVADALGGTQIGSIVDSFNAKIGSLKGGAMVAGAAFAGMAVGGIAVAFGALSKLAIDTAKADAQLLVLANRANTSAENFQILQHAASGLGVTQDQLGSILADVQEKLGEFSATSGGGAADFFDALKNNTKMTDDQIKKFGQTLQGKDGVEAIQMLNDKMDELGVTSQERRFVFESLASDLGNLAPLFAENGDLLNKYGDALKDAGVIKSAEALEQSKLLAAQTESVRMRFDGLKSQLAEQMMPALNSLLSHFIDGATKGGQFGGVIKSVGMIARGVGVVIIGVAASIEVMIKVIAGLIDQAKNVAKTAIDTWNADGVVAKAKATWNGLANAGTLAVGTFVGGASAIQTAMDGVGSILDSAVVKTDKLTEANLAIAEAAKQSAAGLKTNTKEADENAKAKEKAAKETEKLNKQLQVNAKVQSNAAKYNFAGIESQYQLPSGLLSAINMQESRGNANAIGPMTKYGQAKGGFQFLDGTAKRFGLIGNAVFDTGKSAEAAAKYFQFLYQKFGTWEKAISAYHAGEGNVERGTGLGPINREYVKNVLGYMDATLKGVGTTANDAIQYVDETYKAQQSIILKYLNEQEKLELEHAISIQEIREAFAENDPRLAKYIALQQVAYKKDVAEYQEAQKQKELSDKKQLLEVSRNWMTAGDYAREYYALVREEILNTAEYSPEMKEALLQQSVSQQNFEQSSERDQAISDYRDVMGYEENPLEQQFEVLQKMRELDLLNEEAYQNAKLELQAKSTAGYMEGMLGGFASLVDENSKTYAVLFAAQKAFAVAQAMLNIPAAYSKAYDAVVGTPYIGPYIAPAVGAAAAALQVAQAASMKSVNLSGMAHDGINNIPKEGTWLLDKGERVVDSRTNSDLKNYLNEARSNNSGAKITVNNNTGAQVNARQNPDGSVDIDVIERQLAGRLGNPNSTLSKSLKQNTTASRRR